MKLRRLNVRILAALLLLAAAPAAAQAPAANLKLGWAPKALNAPFVAPNRAHWRLAEILKAHAGEKSWSQLVVRDANQLTASYIQTAPGESSPRILYSDTTSFFVVQSGQLRVHIEGVEPFIATKGFVVQITPTRFFHVETVGNEPALRFQVTRTLAHPVYAEGQATPAIPGVRYGRSGFYSQAVAYGDKKPAIDFQKDMVSGGMPGRGAVQDDYLAANINRVAGVPRPPDSDKGHFHVAHSEFWFILENQVDFLIEGVPFFTATQGDVVYAPPGRWHRATSGGTGMATRISIHPTGTSFNALDPVNPGAAGRGGRGGE
jgi:mannose-6-phosphate isomerase-like protein (cupin superfamily)